MTLSSQAGAVEPELAELASTLDTLRVEMLNASIPAQQQLAAIQPGHVASATNLLSYLALRRHDLRPLQARLAGLDSWDDSAARAAHCSPP